MDIDQLPNDLVDIVAQAYIHVVCKRARALAVVMDHVGLLDRWNTINAHNTSQWFMYRRQLHEFGTRQMTMKELIMNLTSLGKLGREISAWMRETCETSKAKEKTMMDMLMAKRIHNMTFRELKTFIACFDERVRDTPMSMHMLSSCANAICDFLYSDRTNTHLSFIYRHYPISTCSVMTTTQKRAWELGAHVMSCLPLLIQSQELNTLPGKDQLIKMTCDQVCDMLSSCVRTSQ